MKKILIFLLSALLFVMPLASCSRPPDISEIIDDLERLILASYEVNQIMFGSGFETYEAIYEPAILEYKDKESGKEYYYVEITDKEDTIIGYKEKGKFENFSYLKKESVKRNEIEVYLDGDGYYYYTCEYTEPEFYYPEGIPDEYDMVKIEELNASIDAIKVLAESVYSKDFCESMYSILFDGIESGGSTELAKYIIYSGNGTEWFMQRNDFVPYATVRRIFLIETASIVSPSRKNRVNIKIDSYYEDDPTNIERKTLTLVLEDGIWLLDDATY